MSYVESIFQYTEATTVVAGVRSEPPVWPMLSGQRATQEESGRDKVAVAPAEGYLAEAMVNYP